MIKLRKEEFGIVAYLFEHPTSSVILSCIQGYLGEIWVDDTLIPQLAIMYAGKTIYVAGSKIDDLCISWIQSFIEERKIAKIEIIPQNQECNNILERYMTINEQSHLKRTYRHLMKLEDMHEKVDDWRTCIDERWDQVQLCEINEHLYEEASSDRYLSNFICNFQSFEEFKNLGMGYLVIYDNKIVGGASSYTRYHQGIEVQIAIAPKFRRRGLAKACAAKLLLKCYEQGLYPNWDAANPASEELAKSLGYKSLRENIVYKYIS